MVPSARRVVHQTVHRSDPLSIGLSICQTICPSVPIYFQTAKILVFEGGEISNDQQQQQNDNNKNKATTTSMTISTTTTTTTTTTTSKTMTILEWRLSSGVFQIPKVTLIEIITESYMLAPHCSLIRSPARSKHSFARLLSPPLTHLLAPHRLLMTMVIWDQFFFQSIQFNQCQFN